MITGYYPFDDAKCPVDLREKVLNKQIDYDVIKNQAVKSVLQRILVRDPNKRATLEELLATAWVTNDWTESIKLQEV